MNVDLKKPKTDAEIIQINESRISKLKEEIEKIDAKISSLQSLRNNLTRKLDNRNIDINGRRNKILKEASKLQSADSIKQATRDGK